jgi:hypothetical protein
MAVKRKIWIAEENLITQAELIEKLKQLKAAKEAVTTEKEKV